MKKLLLFLIITSFYTAQSADQTGPRKKARIENPEMTLEDAIAIIQNLYPDYEHKNFDPNIHMDNWFLYDCEVPDKEEEHNAYFVLINDLNEQVDQYSFDTRNEFNKILAHNPYDSKKMNFLPSFNTNNHLLAKLLAEENDNRKIKNEQRLERLERKRHASEEYDKDYNPDDDRSVSSKKSRLKIKMTAAATKKDLAAYTREKEEERQVPEIPAQAEEAQAASSHHPRALKKIYAAWEKDKKQRIYAPLPDSGKSMRLDRIIEDIFKDRSDTEEYFKKYETELSANGYSLCENPNCKSMLKNNPGPHKCK